MILRHMRLVAPRLARRRQLSVRTLDTPFISDSIPVRTVRVGVSALPSDLLPQGIALHRQSLHATSHQIAAASHQLTGFCRRPRAIHPLRAATSWPVSWPKRWPILLLDVPCSL